MYEVKCAICEEQKKTARYVGETSRSFYERLGEHLYLFKHKKEGDPEKNEASSALWLHSKAVHNGEMRSCHWKTKILSSHRTALNRQITEATIISNEGVDRLLNSKNEFGANNLPELVLQHGTRVEGAAKRRRNLEPEQQQQKDCQTTKQQPGRKKQRMSPANEETTTTTSPSLLILPTQTLQGLAREELTTDTEGGGESPKQVLEKTTKSVVRQTTTTTPLPSLLILPTLTLQSQAKEEPTTDTEEEGGEHRKTTEKVVHKTTDPMKTTENVVRRTTESVVRETTESVVHTSPKRPSISVKTPSPTNYLKWQLPALKALCKDRGIPRTAVKPILIKRLKEWDSKNNTIKVTTRTPKRPRTPDNEDRDRNDDEGGGTASYETPKKKTRLTIFPMYRQKSMKDVMIELQEQQTTRCFANDIVNEIIMNVMMNDVGTVKTTEDADIGTSRDVNQTDDIEVIAEEILEEILQNLQKQNLQNLQTEKVVTNVVNDCYDQKDVIANVIDIRQETTGRTTEQQDANPSESSPPSHNLKTNAQKQSPDPGASQQPSYPSSYIPNGGRKQNGSSVNQTQVNHGQKWNKQAKFDSGVT